MEYLPKSAIKEEGIWTEAAIKKFLGNADKEYPNPRSKKAPYIKLYLEARIKQAEESPKFKEFVEKSKLRKEGAKKGLLTKIENMRSYGSDLEVTIPDFDNLTVLYENAINHFNTYVRDWVENKNQRIEERNFRKSLNDPSWIDDEMYEFTPIHLGTEQTKLNRASVNFLRHQLTNYEKQLMCHHRDNKGKYGENEAYKAIKFRINNAIAEKYPVLTEAVIEINNETEIRLMNESF